MICSRCRTTIEPRKRKCSACGKKVVRRRPKHLAALEQPYEAFVEANGGIDACGICGATKKEGGRALHRDHDHRTGKPRGVLCFRDNTALRPYMTAEWLEAAARYVRRAA